MNFWDTSAVIALIVQEKATETIRAEFAASHDAPVLWTLTSVEAHSAVARRERGKSLTAVQARKVRQKIGEFVAGAFVVVDFEAVKESATRLLKIHELRAADACQLGAALVSVEHRPTAHRFVCLDQRLRRAAEIEGFIVTPAAI